MRIAALLLVLASSQAQANPGDDWVRGVQSQGQVYHDSRGVDVYRSGNDTITTAPGGYERQCHEFSGQTYCREDVPR